MLAFFFILSSDTLVPVTQLPYDCGLSFNRAYECTDIPEMRDRPRDYIEVVQQVCR